MSDYEEGSPRQRARSDRSDEHECNGQSPSEAVRPYRRRGDISGLRTCSQRREPYGSGEVGRDHSQFCLVDA